MFVHNKEMQFEVRVERPDPRFAALLQEQFGGENGELKAAMQYFTQAFTDDPGVQDTLTFLMTREVTHFQQFTAALNELPVNFPPGQAPGDERFQNVAFNLSEGKASRGPWNQGQGPWPKGMEWEYVKNPTRDWLGGSARQNRGPQDNPDGTPAVHADTPFAHEQHGATT